GDRDDAIALLLEVGGDERGETLLVLDQQNAGGHRSMLTRGQEAQLGRGLAALRRAGEHYEGVAGLNAAERGRLPVDEDSRPHVRMDRHRAVAGPGDDDGSLRDRLHGREALAALGREVEGLELLRRLAAVPFDDRRETGLHVAERREPAVDEHARLRADGDARRAAVEGLQEDGARRDGLDE